MLYQRAYELVKAERSMEIVTNENKALMAKIDFVIEQNSGLAKQNEGLAKQLENQDQKLDTLSKILYKESDDKVLGVKNVQKKQELVILQDMDEPEKCEVLRGQKMHVKSQLKRKQDRMTVVGKIKTYKNPINLYNRFSEQTKKQKDTRFEVVHNKVILKNGTTPNELLDFFNALNDQKHEIAERVQQTL